MNDLEAQFLGVYRVKDIQKILQIGQVAAYRLVHSGEFPVIAVGRSYRIPQKGIPKVVPSKLRPG